MKIELMSLENLTALCEDTKPMSTTDDGKVLVLRKGDNEYIKFFYPKPGFSSDKVFPFYKRFVDNAEKLRLKHIATVSVINVYYSPDKKCHIVVYHGVIGETLHVLLSRGDLSIDHFIAEFVRLHEAGVFFRDLHFRNILQQPSGEFALIDIADCHIFKRPLGLYRRARNIARVLRSYEDISLYQAYGVQNFITNYCQVAKFSPLSIMFFRGALILCKLYRAKRLQDFLGITGNSERTSQ